jgi:voltage-gated potassium channel
LASSSSLRDHSGVDGSLQKTGWGIFLLEYLIRLGLAPRRRHFVVHNLPDLVVVAVPMLRPLRLIRSVRVLRILRLSRLSALTSEGTSNARRSLHSRVTAYVVVLTGALILITSVVVFDLERDAKASNIKSMGDALWWAVATVTTVGYGDRYPVTPGGRAVGVILMIGGIGLLGIITAAIAAFFVQQNQGRGKPTSHESEVLRRLEAIEAALARLGAEPVAHLTSPATPPSVAGNQSGKLSP